MMEDFETGRSYPTLAGGESILWRGKPKRSAFIATKSLSLLPIAVIWLILDLNIMGSAFSGGQMIGFFIPFFALHLMPVWIWLANVITASRRWKNTNYYVTNRRIIIQGGYFAVNETSLFYKDLRNAHMRVGFLNKIFQTGNITFDDGTYGNSKQKRPHALEDLENPEAVYNRIQKVILDIQTDIEYPNAYRPEENPGYQTQYRP